MDDASRLSVIIIFILVLLISIFFYISEISVVGISEHKLKKILDEKGKKAKAAKALLKLKEEATKFTLATSMIGTLCISLGITIGTFFLSKEIFLYTANIQTIDINNPFIKILVILLSFIVCSFVIINIGQLIPKRIAGINPEKTAFFAIYPLIFFITFFKPFIYISSFFTKIILRLFGIKDNNDSSDVTEEEIRMLVDAGNESGVIELSEKEMINNIFEFDDRTAYEVMTHRTSIIACKKDDKVSTIISLAIEHGFSRIPIYNESIDNIIGIIYVKDLLSLVSVNDTKDICVNKFLRKIIYVPGSSRCQTLFKEFKLKKVHMAVVVDEYGGTDGIVTMEDLIESIVGDIEDEYDQVQEECTKIDESTYIFSGGISAEEVEDILGITIEDLEDGDTLAGALLNKLEFIPSENEHPTVNIDKYKFTILSVEDKRISRVKATLNIDYDTSIDNED